MIQCERDDLPLSPRRTCAARCYLQ